MVAPLFLISFASLTHLLYLFCSMPMTLALSHPMTWFCSTTWSVTADMWTVDSDSFLLALVNTDLLTLSTSVLRSLNRVPNLRPVSPMYSRLQLLAQFFHNMILHSQMSLNCLICFFFVLFVCLFVCLFGFFFFFFAVQISWLQIYANFLFHLFILVFFFYLSKKIFVENH